MHLRVANLVPDLSPRFGEFTMNQLCALRFASDAELPELARKDPTHLEARLVQQSSVDDTVGPSQVHELEDA